MEKLLSLCMIVKDEEDVIGRCLDSVKHLVDEIIVVDTGSTDRTLDIVAKYTDSIHKFEWINDFAAAKNEALRHATGQWILVLDADEYVEESDIEPIKFFLRNQTVNPKLAYNVRILNFTGSSIRAGRITESNADRIFPNYSGIRYDRPIHEQLVSADGNVIHHRKCPLRIYHTGYIRSRMESKQKSKRNLALFDKLRAERPMEAYDYFTLGNEYKAQREHELAAEAFLQALETGSPTKPWYIYCVTAAISVLILLERMDEAWKLLRSTAEYWNHYPEYSAMEGALYQYFGKYDKAVECFERAIEVGEQLARQNTNAWVISPDYATKIPFGELASIYQRKFNKQQAIYYLTKSLLHDPNQLGVTLKLSELLLQTEDPAWIRSFYEQIMGASYERKIPALFHCFLTLGHVELADFYLQRLSESTPIINRLRLAILTSDQALFRNMLSENQPDKENEKYAKTLITAAIVWRNPAYIEMLELPSEHEYCAASSVVTRVLQGKVVEETDIGVADKQLLLLLTDLFYLKQFEAFEWFIQALDSSSLRNQLVSFFFSKQYFELAIHFASVQLRHNQLDADGYEHLGMFYVAEGEIEEGLSFLKEALLQKPSKLHLYHIYYDLCRSPQEQMWTRQQFAQFHDKHLDLPFMFTR